jgi:DNA-binding transcriptional LysR family regulator
MSDLRRVQSQVADLSGIRRGHVSVACSQALVPYFMPEQIALYRQSHPGVTFSVSVRDREAAERDLSTFRSDIALVFEPILLVDFEVLMSVPQTIHVLMRPDHPLAAQQVLRLRDCLDHRHVVPSRQYGVRHLLDAAAARGTRAIAPVVEADSFDFMRHYVLHEDAIAFQIPIGLRPGPVPGMVARPLSARDVPAGNLLLGQMRGRTLPVASARFAQSLGLALQALT